MERPGDHRRRPEWSEVEQMTRTSRQVGAVVGAVALLGALTGCSGILTPAAQPAAAVAPVAVASSAPSKVATATPTPTPTVTKAASTACTHSAAGTKHIYISIAKQHLWACSGTTLFLDGAVTTGASALTNVHNATPVGTTRITSKTRNTVLSGSDVNGSWNDPVHYWMPFNGGDGFHDSPWQTFPLGDKTLYKTQGSHGCVHMSLHDVAKLYGWAPVGTLVTVKA